MADKYIAINGFKYGLDGRKEILTSVPGTLAELINAHINPGGEIEQRMSFVRGTDYPTNTFGLQDTDTGLMTFGSADVGALSGPLPSGVSYQQLSHPTGFDGVTPIIMVGVVYSCNFLGKAFVIVEYSDGTKFAFYNGLLVGSSRNGLVLKSSNVGHHESTVDIANDLVSQVIQSGWSADANQIISGTPPAAISRAGGVVVRSPPGVHFTPVASYNAVNGILGVAEIDRDVDGTAATPAAAAFTISGGSAGDTITITLLSAPTLAISGGPVTETGAGAVQLAKDVAAAVNLYSNITGFTATFVAATNAVTVYAPPSYGNYTGSLHVVATGGITITSTSPGGGLVVTATPPNVSVLKQVSASTRSMTLNAHIIANATGAVGPPTYLWEVCNADGSTSPLLGYNFSLTGIHSANVGVTGVATIAQAAEGYVKVTVTSAGATGSPSPPKVIPVTLEIWNNL